MSTEIQIELPAPGRDDLKGCRLGGEQYGEQLGEQYSSVIRLADRRNVLTAVVNDMIFGNAWHDMTATAKRIAGFGFNQRELRHFWRGARIGYRRAMVLAGDRKFN